MIKDDHNKVSIIQKKVGDLKIDSGSAVIADWSLFELLLTRIRVEAENGDEALQEFL